MENDYKPDESATRTPEVYQPHVSVQGVGRVGMSSRIKCRAHRHWIVTYRDGSKTEHGYALLVAEELGTFRTKRTASEAAAKFASERGWQLDSYAIPKGRPQ